MRALGYDQVALVPRVISEINSRKDVDTSTSFGNIKLSLPLIASPMPDVCNGYMANKLSSLGILGIIHRFQSIQEQCDQLKLLDNDLYAACAIGLGGDYQERFYRLYDHGCRIFCIDTANGANIRLKEPITFLKEHNVFVIAGNVASREGFKWLSEIGADAVRQSIATGSVCETKTETGILYPMFSCIKEAAEEKYKLNCKTLIIADGGVKIPAHLCKALAVGADVIMAGGLFSGCKESPSDTIKVDGKLYKIMRGAASFSVQHKINGKEPQFVEGKETLVEHQGGVEKVVERFKNGLRSSMSYMNARNLTEFRKNVSFIEI